MDHGPLVFSVEYGYNLIKFMTQVAFDLEEGYISVKRRNQSVTLYSTGILFIFKDFIKRCVVLKDLHI